MSKAQKLPSQLGLISNLVVAAAVEPGAHISAVLLKALFDLRWHAPAVQKCIPRGLYKASFLQEKHNRVQDWLSASRLTPPSPRRQKQGTALIHGMNMSVTLKCYELPPFTRARDSSITQQRRFHWVPNHSSKSIPLPHCLH